MKVPPKTAKKAKKSVEKVVPKVVAPEHNHSCTLKPQQLGGDSCSSMSMHSVSSSPPDVPCSVKPADTQPRVELDFAPMIPDTPQECSEPKNSISVEQQTVADSPMPAASTETIVQANDESQSGSPISGLKQDPMPVDSTTLPSMSQPLLRPPSPLPPPPPPIDSVMNPIQVATASVHEMPHIESSNASTLPTGLPSPQPSAAEIFAQLLHTEANKWQLIATLPGT